MADIRHFLATSENGLDIGLCQIDSFNDEQESHPKLRGFFVLQGLFSLCCVST